MSTQLVVFAMDSQEFGLDVSVVHGILRAKKFSIQTLPGTSKEIEGIINLRGTVNYIFNLRTKFGLPEKGIEEEEKFIMLNYHNSTVGWIVDEVTDIVKLEETDLEQAPKFINSGKTNYINGIGKIGDRMITILNPDKLLLSMEKLPQN